MKRDVLTAETLVKCRGSCPGRQTDSIIVRMSDVDEEAALKDQSALTLSRHNEALIQAEQTGRGRKENRKGRSRQIYRARR